MKWIKETQAYMWAHYYSEDGRWKAWDEDVAVKSNRTEYQYNSKTKKVERVAKTVIKHTWFLQNLETGEIVDIEFKRLKDAKEYAETH